MILLFVDMMAVGLKVLPKRIYLFAVIWLAIAASFSSVKAAQTASFKQDKA
jgi:hypothetical protein